MNESPIAIDKSLVVRLIAAQFPHWKDLAISPVTYSGWDNRTFHLGQDMLVRLPSAAQYALQVEKEQRWLSRLAPFLPLTIPKPLALGEPSREYPWKWSIYQWIEGTTAASSSSIDLCECANRLAHFLIALQTIKAKGGPIAGEHSFYRGSSLKYYEAETKKALLTLKGKIDTDKAYKIWQKALVTNWQGDPVWVHGDISLGNLLFCHGRLSAVIDFGQMAVGDPACDLAINWTLFEGKSQKIFQSAFNLDEGTWERSRAWALWKALIVAAGFTDPKNIESAKCWHIIENLLNIQT